MTLIFDATPLIYLAKVDRLDLIEDIEERCVIPQEVYAEVVEDGLQQGYPDARRVDRCVESDRLEVVTVEETALFERLRENENLSRADIAVLACAETRDGIAVMDEAYGRNVADVERIRTRGTAYLVLSLAKRGAIDVEEARSIIDDMIDEGWYCSPDVYTAIVRKLESLH